MNFFLTLLYWCFFALAGVSCYETVEDAAVIARTLVNAESIGIMATVFSSQEAYPGLADHPFALQEYYANCYSNGSLTILVLPISKHSQNIMRSSNHSATISVSSKPPAARKPRVALMGTVTVFDNSTAQNTLSKQEEKILKECYLAVHPDAKWWLPYDKNGAHISYWARFDPQSVYFVGGFGGLHYIGFIPLDLYATSKPRLDRVLTEQLHT